MNKETTITGDLRVFINQLRSKIEPDPRRPRYFLTEPWIGYRFRPDYSDEHDSARGDARDEEAGSRTLEKEWLKLRNPGAAKSELSHQISM